MAWGKTLSKKPNMPGYLEFNMKCEQVKIFAQHNFLKFFTLSKHQTVSPLPQCTDFNISEQDTMWCTIHHGVWTAFKSFHACFEEFSSLSIISLNPSIDHAHLNRPSIKFLMEPLSILLSVIQSECQTMVKASKLNHSVIMEKYREAHSLMKRERGLMFKKQNKWHSAWLFNTSKWNGGARWISLYCLQTEQNIITCYQNQTHEMTFPVLNLS